MTQFVCWDCEKQWKKNQRVHYVPSVIVEGTTDDVCNKCYSKRKL